MKILFVHNSYQQHGGEDEVMANERDLLRSAGHEIVEYVCSNDEIRDYSAWHNVTLGLRTIWAWDSAREVKELRITKSRAALSGALSQHISLNFTIGLFGLPRNGDPSGAITT